MKTSIPPCPPRSLQASRPSILFTVVNLLLMDYQIAHAQEVGLAPFRGSFHQRKEGEARVQAGTERECSPGTRCLRGQGTGLPGKGGGVIKGGPSRNTVPPEDAPEFSLDSLRLKGAELAAFKARMGPRGVSLSVPPVCNIRVGLGAGSQFQKIQDAVDSVGQNPKGATVVICIGAGVYHETVTVGKGQDGIAFVGEGPETIIANNMSLSQTGNTWMSATLIVYGENFRATNLMIQNTFQTTKDPAPAVSILSRVSRWEAVSMTAWQDTVSVYTGSGHLFTNCFISGIVDVTWGFGRAAFVNSTIYIRRLDDPDVISTGLVATYGTDKASGDTPAGGLFWNCAIDGETSALLARPYRKQSMAIFVDCFLGEVLQRQGYVDRRGYLDSNDYTYLEFNSRGPGTAQRRRFGQVLNSAPPQEYTVTGFLVDLQKDT